MAGAHFSSQNHSNSFCSCCLTSQTLLVIAAGRGDPDRNSGTSEAAAALREPYSHSTGTEQCICRGPWKPYQRPLPSSQESHCSIDLNAMQEHGFPSFLSRLLLKLFCTFGKRSNRYVFFLKAYVLKTPQAQISSPQKPHEPEQEAVPPAPWPRCCRVSKPSKRGECEHLPKGEAVPLDLACQEVSIHTATNPAPSHWKKAVAEKAAAHTERLDVPRRHGLCLLGTRLCFFVSWTTKKASVFFSDTTKNTVLAVPQIGSASVLQNLIKALRAANHAM